MKRLALAATAFAVTAGTAHAGGLDRSGTPIDIIFEQGNYAELSLGFVTPDLTGSDLLGNSISNVGGDFTVFGGALKLDFGERLSFALIADEPYGSDVEYGGNPATTLLGTTSADAESFGITALLKYRPTDRISVYGGPRVASAKGEITLGGLAYGPLSGYNVKFRSDNGVGAVLGAAYEIPEIAFRASLTWHSSIDLSMSSFENIPVAAGGPGFPVVTGDTQVELPQSVKLAVQSGVAKDTLVFGSVRWSEWEAFSLDPPSAVPNLAQLDDSITYQIGVGRRFTEKLSASLSYTHETGGSDNIVSPLAPTDGSQAISLGAKYKVSDAIDISAGIRYTVLGDARPETGTPDTVRGNFKNNDAISVGLKLGVHF
ncbi:outer membrane beta-barrel protein [uncultured Roseovarius sp.]|uniref:OmpP1/FadL family transporter n=1 Tax=uncultured Roseovarius sp. TaxID=293344 RepID=UPI00260AAFA1|nr:outer membrane beta-barrel protein [uncultured Roseovarius sp.]